MTISISNLLFDEPYLDLSALQERAGVYVILDLNMLRFRQIVMGKLGDRYSQPCSVG